MKKERSTPFQFKEGYYAFSRGWLTNKYDIGSTNGKEWQRGFEKAYFDNLYKLEKRVLSSVG